MNRSDRTIREQPFRQVLRDRTLSLLWLARRIGLAHSWVRSVACGYQPASANFRAKVAAALELPEHDLFWDDDGTSSASAPEEDSVGSINRAGLAVGTPVYPIRQEVRLGIST